MKVALTGANGFIGSHILAELGQHGHQVTALVRDDAQAGPVAANGATPVVVDLYDRSAVTKVLDAADGAITEQSALNAPPLVAWKPPIEERVLDAERMRGMVVVAAVAYGDGGGGIPGLLLGSPRDRDGRLVMLGTGQQHWSTVHAADLADFFRRALEDESARGRYIVHNGLNPTVAELTEAAAVAAGASGAVPGSDTR
jgi:nucleoside-diphosphate-sugar epimerase